MRISDWSSDVCSSDLVEKNVQDARHRLWQPMPQAESLDGLNLWLEQRCRALWQEIPHGIEPGSVADAWAAEVECLMPVGRPFDGFVEHGKRVSPTCLVHPERTRYSVTASFANQIGQASCRGSVLHDV